MSPNLFENLIQKAWNTYSKDVGKSLIHWGSVGWVFSSLAQVFAIGINKNIDKKEKKFLIPQELSDGAVNVGLYYTITQGIKSLGDWLVESGSFIKKDTADFLNAINTRGLSLKDFVKQHGSISKILNNLKTNRQLAGVDSAVLNSALAVLDKSSDSFSHWKNGIGTVFTICASVLACNVITPYCRNKIASGFQKKHIERANILKDNYYYTFNQGKSSVFKDFKF